MIDENGSKNLGALKDKGAHYPGATITPGPAVSPSLFDHVHS